MTKISAQLRAEKSRDVMWEQDKATQWFGMTCESIGPGEAVVSMKIELHHCNGHKTCHGAVSYALADSAFAFACNSYNQACVAQHNSITYLAAAFAGDVLTARATEVSRVGRSGIYDIRVTNQNNETIAEFRGGSRMIKGTHFDEENP